MYNSPIFNAPSLYGGGSRRLETQRMLQYGQQIRDELLWQYPILPEAVMTYQQIASSREVKVSASNARAAARAVDWLNNAVCYNLDGSIDYGFQPVLKRRILDYICIGRTTYYIGDDLTYLDPINMQFVFDPNRPFWHHKYNNVKYTPEELIVNHPYPIGGSGYFMCPLAPVIPKAMLAWLLDEHDRAAADGRKIRDIIIAGSESLADTLVEAMEKSLKLWSGADVTKNGVPMAYLEQMPPTGSVQDMIGRLGLAEIPPQFNRADFEFTYVNEIASALGIALRHFWNSEKATNRALEDVQEARQLQKGPSEFIRTEQRLLNNHPNAMKRFGQKTRMGFIEETDTQTQRTRAEVLKFYSDALISFAKVFGGQVNGDAFLAWLQSEDILPADLELVTDLGVMINMDQRPAEEGTALQDVNGQVSPIESGSKSETAEKSITPPPLDYDEVSMDLRYNIIDKRVRTFNGIDLVAREMSNDPEYLKSLEMPKLEFYSILDSARKSNYEVFSQAIRSEIINDIPTDQNRDALLEASITAYDDLTSEQHKLIGWFVNDYYQEK